MNDRLRGGIRHDVRDDRTGPDPREPIPRVEYGIMTAQAVTVVGFVCLVGYALVDAIWGSYLGADPSVGMTLSGTVLLAGVAFGLLLALGRELPRFGGPLRERLTERS